MAFKSTSNAWEKIMQKKFSSIYEAGDKLFDEDNEWDFDEEQCDLNYDPDRDNEYHDALSRGASDEELEEISKKR